MIQYIYSDYDLLRTLLYISTVDVYFLCDMIGWFTAPLISDNRKNIINAYKGQTVTFALGTTDAIKRHLEQRFYAHFVLEYLPKHIKSLTFEAKRYTA